MRNLLIVGGTVSVAVLGYGYLRNIMGVDPFASLRSDKGKSRIAFQLKDVDTRHYRQGRLVGQAHAETVDVASNKKVFDLSKITDGVFYSDEGRIDFTAEQAEWHATHLRLMVSEGAHVTHEDFDLRVPSFNIEQRTSVLRAPG